MQGDVTDRSLDNLQWIETAACKAVQFDISKFMVRFNLDVPFLYVISACKH